MKTNYLFLLFCLFLGSLCSNAQDESALIKAVKTKLDKVKDYQAKGIMNIDVPFIKAPQSAVTIFFKKPDLFKIQKQDGLAIFPKGGMSMNMGSLLGNTQYTAVPSGEA